jgi:membrane protein DedA with SNARE-associated domain
MKPAPVVFAVLLGVTVIHCRRQLSRAALALAAIAFVGLLAYAIGLIRPPSFELMLRDAVGTLLGTHAHALVGALAFLDTGAGIGLIAPGELAVIVGGVSAGQGQIDLVTLIVVVWTCALGGDITSFVLGRRLGREFLIRRGPKVGISRQRLEQFERFFAAHGGKTIIIGRFIGVVRAISPFIAGASRMPSRRFLPYTTLAAGLWAATFSTLGYAFRQSLDQLIALTKQGALALAAVIALGMAASALYRHLRGRSSPTPPSPVTRTNRPGWS